MDFERVIEFLKDLWQAMLDYWVLTLIIISIVLTPVAGIVFGILKLVDHSKQNHKYDD